MGQATTGEGPGTRPTTIRTGATAALVLALAVGCGDDPVASADRCDLRPLPLAAAAGAPIVTDVAIEVQSTGLVLLLTATSELGADAFEGKVARVGIYPDDRCVGTPVTADDDLACSGCEESFGTLVEPAGDPALYAAVSAASRWPVEVSVTDRLGRETEGQVEARVVR